MPLAIQETMLPGRGVLERLQAARELGFAGVEFSTVGLTERVPEIADALEKTGLRASAVYAGTHCGHCDPDPAAREAAIARLRQSMADALDIGAAGVIFVAHRGALHLPDLTPFHTPVQLAAELTWWLLRQVSDLAYALGVELYLLPVNPYESPFINTLADAAIFRRKINDHPHVKLAANSFHMALAEADLGAALREHAADVAYVQLADSNRRLPGQGMMNLAALADALRAINYDGWITLEHETPDSFDTRRAAELALSLPACVEGLRAAGLVDQ